MFTRACALRFSGFSRSFRYVSPLLCCLALLLARPVQANERVRLQLNWQHQFEFAGFYAAKAKGFYRDVGLDVDILESQPGESPEQQVIDGHAEFGLADAGLLLRRSKGVPVVVLGVIFQHSPVVLLVPKNGAQTVAELRGKRVMMADPNTELQAYFHHEGLEPGAYTRVDPSYAPDDLISGRVDAMQAYASDEPDYLSHAGFAYRALTARDAGIDFYDLNFFTLQAQIDQHPQRVKAFREATLRGWKYALEHPDEIMDVLQRDYSEKHSREHLRFQYQQMVPLIQPVLVEVGYMNPERWQNIVDTYIQQQMLPANFSLDGFLYDVNPPRNLTALYLGLLLTIALLAGVSVVALRFARLTRHLRHEIRERRVLQAQLQRQVQTDYLTGLASRRHFMQQAQGEVARAQRYGTELSLCMLDLDHFKAINDRHGHQTGDLVLQHLGELCRQSLREIDLAARLGGEEFVILLPETDLQRARQVAERLRVSLEQSTLFSEAGVPFACTTSIGVVTLSRQDDNLDSLLARADHALYAAKEAGRNRVGGATA
jgi:diguanylate cyclase (GGDEF)-like protein